MQVIEYATNPQIYNHGLRKLETPFLSRLTRDTVSVIERQSYYGAYKGVTDILTKYLWPELALWLTRIAARLGMTPNMVTAIGAVGCISAVWLFAMGWFWSGVAAGFVFMVLDTVDGKLARCTITSSKWGNVADHGVDLIAELELVQNLLNIRGEAIEISLEVRLQLLPARAGCEVSQAELRGVVERFPGGLAQRGVLIGNASLVELRLHCEHGVLGRLQHRIKTPNHRHRQNDIPILSPDIDVAQDIVGDVPDEIADVQFTQCPPPELSCAACFC